jgi:hypothetical protein
MRSQGTRRQIALQTMLLPLDRQLQCSASLNYESVVATSGAREGTNIGLTVAAWQIIKTFSTTVSLLIKPLELEKEFFFKLNSFLFSQQLPPTTRGWGNPASNVERWVEA